MAPQNGHLLFSSVVLALFSSYVRSAILTDERFLHFQLRRDRASLRDLLRHSQCTLISILMRSRYSRVLAPAVMFFLLVGTASGQNTTRIALDQAIDLALAHNHSLKATRTLVLQNQAQEITANLRPNPTLGVDTQFIPLFSPQDFSGRIWTKLSSSTSGSGTSSSAVTSDSGGCRLLVIRRRSRAPRLPTPSAHWRLMSASSSSACCWRNRPSSFARRSERFSADGRYQRGATQSGYIGEGDYLKFFVASTNSSYCSIRVKGAPERRFGRRHDGVHAELIG